MTVLLLERLHLNELRYQNFSKKMANQAASANADKSQISKQEDNSKATLKSIERTI